MTRMKLSMLIALVLTVHAPGPVAHAKPPEADPAVADADALYKDHRFLEAALAFEALALRDVKYHYYAGLAREALGHDGQAIMHWQRVNAAPEVDPALRKRARARAEQAEARTTRLFIRVAPTPATPGVTVYLTYQGAGERPRRVIKPEALADGIYLESGTWKIEVRSGSKNYLPGTDQVTVSVREAEKTVEIALAPITAKVFLTITPQAAADSRPRLTLRDDAGVETAITLDAKKSSSPLQLHPGLWTYSIEAPGFEQTDGRFHVRGGENTRFSISLSPRSRATNTRPLAIGAGVSSGLLATGGTLGLVFSEKKLTFQNSRAIVVTDKPTRWALDGLILGNIAIGASVGFVVTAGTAAIKGNKQRRRAWITEAALGGLLSAGGGIWAGHYFFRTWAPEFLDKDAERRDLNPDDLKKYRQKFHPSALMIGTGAALLVGAIAGLALDRRAPRKHGRHASARIRTFLPLTVDF